MREQERDRQVADLPDYPVGMAAMGPKRGGPDAKRKGELFQLAQGIAAQVGELTRPHERCLLRQMVEMLLD